MAIGHTAQTLPTYEAATFDLVYIDAGHFYPDVKADAREAARIVKPDGTLIFNDYTMADHLTRTMYGVVHAVNELVVSTDWKVVGFALNYSMYCDIALRRV